MRTLILRKDRFADLANELVKAYKVIAPNDELSYGPISSAQEIHLSAEKPRKSLKEFFFAPQCNLFQYRVDGDEVTVSEPDGEETEARVILGAHPCDVAALPILDKVFMWDYIDPFYVKARQGTTIISLGCNEPCDACFCVSVDGSPVGTDGSDILLTPLGQEYHVQVITERGESLVGAYQHLFEPSSPERDEESTRLGDEWCERVSTVDTQGLAESLNFDSPVWQSVAQQCVDCGICTFLCPTCHCFDIQDEGGPAEGTRVRLWDSCAFRSFTKTVVHEPRVTHTSRYRQRIMHKFGYYPKNFGRTLCVGCGRCIEYCPVSIDIRQVLQTVRS